MDEVDAALAPLTGLLVLEGKYWTVGQSVEGVIVLPGEPHRAPFPGEPRDGEVTHETNNSAENDLHEVIERVQPRCGSPTTDLGYTDPDKQQVVRATGLSGSEGQRPQPARLRTSLRATTRRRRMCPRMRGKRIGHSPTEMPEVPGRATRAHSVAISPPPRLNDLREDRGIQWRDYGKAFGA
jgi:hypothetical protein